MASEAALGAGDTADEAMDWAEDEIARLRAENARLRQPREWRAAPWDDGSWIVTCNGKPVGATMSEKDAKDAALTLHGWETNLAMEAAEAAKGVAPPLHLRT